MEVVDVKKLETAVLYLQRITEGRNPVNNMPAEEDAIINNPNVLRCMYFVKEIMEEVLRNDGYIGRKPKAKKEKEADKLDFPVDCLAKFEYADYKSISRLTDQLNSYIDASKYKKISFRPIRQWLIDNGYLEEVPNEATGRRDVIATPKGLAMEIRNEESADTNGNKSRYAKYGKKAQEFIVANMDKILAKNS